MKHVNPIDLKQPRLFWQSFRRIVPTGLELSAGICEVRNRDLIQYLESPEERSVPVHDDEAEPVVVSQQGGQGLWVGEVVRIRHDTS